MCWPEHNEENGRMNCPEGTIHVPHLFLEAYFNVPPNAYREGKQYLTLSNGDHTGYSIHADFMAGWDEVALQHIIDHCNNEHEGVHMCPGMNITMNWENCTIDSRIDENVDTPLRVLPGDNPITGWGF